MRPPVDTPPRFTGDYNQDVGLIAGWMATAYRQLVVADAIRLRVGEVTKPVAALSGSPDPQVIQDKLNELIAALKGSS